MNPSPEADFLHLVVYLWSVRFRIAAATLVVATVSLVAAFVIPPSFESRALALYPRESSNEFVAAISGVTRRGGTGEGGVMLMGVAPPSYPSMDYTVGVLKSRTAVETVMKRLKLTDRWKVTEKKAFKTLNKAFVVVRNPREGKLSLSYEDRDPALAQEILKEFLKFYDEYAKTTTNTASGRQVKFLEGQVKEAEKRTSQVQESLERFLKRYGPEIVEGEPEAQAQILGELYKQRLEAEGKAIAARAAKDRLQGRLSAVPDILEENNLFPAPVIDPVLDNLQMNLFSEQLDLKNLALINTERHPRSVVQQGRVDNVRSLFEQKISGLRDAYNGDLTPELLTAEAEAAANEARLERTRNLLDSQEERMRDVLQIQAEFETLEASYKLERTVYDMLQVELARSRVIKARDAATLEIIDPPNLPKEKVFPAKSLFLAGGLVGGFVLSCGLAMLSYLRKAWFEPLLNPADEHTGG
ncbi:MAG: Wzz/FepE/Etk N-terminal domain-containing protein [Candidatus Eremiobacterota bacterium]